MKANDKQVGGAHYARKGIQPWDVVHAFDMGFFEGNIFKYIVRYKRKGGVQDLEKAKHYLEKLIELRMGEADDARGKGQGES